MSSTNASAMNLNWPLMQNNIARADLGKVIDFLKGEPILTQSKNVRAFEEEWSSWLGVKHSVFVNSGSSANLITLSALRETYGPGELIVPALTWVSDIASTIQAGFTPVFVDIDPKTLGMDTEEVIRKFSKKTKAVFLTHILGHNALTDKLIATLRERKIPLIEDVCESHGATFGGEKCGTFGLASNFSFYYAHHLTTIEGGMVSTDDKNLYEMLRMFRSHGLVRESSDKAVASEYAKKYPDLNPEFIFAYPSFNVRSTEINAVLGRAHLKRLDEEITKRNRNMHLFLDNLDGEKYRTDLYTEGASNYAFTLIIRKPDPAFAGRVMDTLKAKGVEFRRGTSGGGNQLRQPYLKGIVGQDEYKKYPNVEHIHFYGFYIGNYPDLEADKIMKLCEILNGIP